jgi:hypothetical protein
MARKQIKPRTQKADIAPTIRPLTPAQLDALDVGDETLSAIQFLSNALTSRASPSLDQGELVGLSCFLRVISQNVEYLCQAIDPAHTSRGPAATVY